MYFTRERKIRIFLHTLWEYEINILAHPTTHTPSHQTTLFIILTILKYIDKLQKCYSRSQFYISIE